MRAFKVLINNCVTSVSRFRISRIYECAESKSPWNVCSWCRASAVICIYNVAPYSLCFTSPVNLFAGENIGESGLREKNRVQTETLTHTHTSTRTPTHFKKRTNIQMRLNNWHAARNCGKKTNKCSWDLKVNGNKTLNNRFDLFTLEIFWSASCGSRHNHLAATYYEKSNRNRLRSEKCVEKRQRIQL